MKTLLKNVCQAMLTSAFLLGAAAEARYVVSTYQNNQLDPSKNTHIIVAAKGGDMGLQFHMSGASLARKILDVNPQDQVVLLAVIDNGKGGFMGQDYSRRLETGLMNFNIINQENENDMKRANARTKLYTKIEDGILLVLQQWGFSQVNENRDDLTAKNLVKELSQFQRIRSVNVFSHSTAYYGLILDGSGDRLDPKDTNLFAEIKDRFTPGAYAWLHGCNNAIVASRLTSLWSIPVAASYTSTAFQELFRDQSNQPFFVHSYENNIPEGSRRLGVNNISFKRSQECLKVPCVRMKPDNYAYVGYWGNFRDGGLGFYRFICASHVGDQKCKMGMAIGLTNQVNSIYTDYNSSLEDFKKIAQDNLCPVGDMFIKKSTFAECAKNLEASLTNPSLRIDTFLSKSLQCDRRTCQASVKCEAAEFAGASFLTKKSCSITNRKDPNVMITTQVQEYRDLIEGFE
ncbi:MAG: hypothetical protein ACK5V3_03435, partial [Bdellovibrionales bacterium]